MISEISFDRVFFCCVFLSASKRQLIFQINLNPPMGLNSDFQIGVSKWDVQYEERK